MRRLNPRPARHTSALLLCVLALFVAQTFGGPRSYLCVCGGRPVPAQTSHCHGSQGSDCHTDCSTADGTHRQDGSGPCQEQHQVVTEIVQARPLEAAAQVVAPAVLREILPVAELTFAGGNAKVRAGKGVDFGDSPPSGVMVARTVVLRI